MTKHRIKTHNMNSMFVMMTKRIIIHGACSEKEKSHEDRPPRASQGILCHALYQRHEAVSPIVKYIAPYIYLILLLFSEFEGRTDAENLRQRKKMTNGKNTYKYR
jgi:hypothetical protein